VLDGDRLSPFGLNQPASAIFGYIWIDLVAPCRHRYNRHVITVEAGKTGEFRPLSGA
jgi:hypothetical protein